MELGVYLVLDTEDEDGVHQLVESRHVTFDESRFPGAHVLKDYMDDERASDADFDTRKVFRD